MYILHSSDHTHLPFYCKSIRHIAHPLGHTHQATPIVYTHQAYCTPIRPATPIRSSGHAHQSLVPLQVQLHNHLCIRHGCLILYTFSIVCTSRHKGHTMGPILARCSSTVCSHGSCISELAEAFCYWSG